MNESTSQPFGFNRAHNLLDCMYDDLSKKYNCRKAEMNADPFLTIHCGEYSIHIVYNVPHYNYTVYMNQDYQPIPSAEVYGGGETVRGAIDEFVTNFMNYVHNMIMNDNNGYDRLNMLVHIDTLMKIVPDIVKSFLKYKNVE